jgi:glycosyltransferase involved in cell wall biosynthesis
MAEPIRVAFILHVMQVAGAEVLVAETIRRLGRRIEPVVLCLDAVGQLGLRMQTEGVPVIAYGRRSGWDLGLPKRMARDLRSYRIEVVHAHQYTPFFYSALAARLVRPRPYVIFTEHGRHYPDIVSGKRRWFNRAVLSKMADRVTAVCDFSARALREKDGFDRTPIEVIENGIDVGEYANAPDRAALRTALGLDVNRRYVACVARFHAVKDHRTLVTAFAKVAEGRPDVDLLLVGDGVLKADIQGLAVSLGLSNRVHFLGVRGDVADILQAVDLFAMTSVSEAASITLLEAMAAGLPVVVTAVGGNPEIVRDGKDGLLVPRSDAGAAAAAMGRILDDAGLARSLGASGARRVRDHFRLDRTITTYGDLFEAGASRVRVQVAAKAGA